MEHLYGLSTGPRWAHGRVQVPHLPLWSLGSVRGASYKQ